MTWEEAWSTVCEQAGCAADGITLEGLAKGYDSKEEVTKNLEKCNEWTAEQLSTASSSDLGSPRGSVSGSVSGGDDDAVDRAKATFEAEDESNITIAVGDSDWWEGYVEGNPETVGYFPSSFVEAMASGSGTGIGAGAAPGRRRRGLPGLARA